MEKVGYVYYFGFLDYLGYEIVKKQMCYFGGMVFFDLKDDCFDYVVKVFSNIKIFILVELFGGVELFIGYFVFMMYVFILWEECLKVGFMDLLIWLSVGVEDVEDFIQDLKQVLVQL